jgi:hypothetical protein
VDGGLLTEQIYYDAVGNAWRDFEIDFTVPLHYCNAVDIAQTGILTIPKLVRTVILPVIADVLPPT